MTEDKKNLHIGALTALIAGFALRAIQTNPKGLWLDEIWSMINAAPNLSIATVITNAANDSHPPLFDVILHYWLIIFGTSEVAAKTLPLFFALISVYATWYTTLNITKSTTKAWFALGLVSLNFFHLYYSTEVRFYSLLYLLGYIALFQFWNIIKSNTLKSYTYYILCGIALAYTHYYGAILLFVYGVIALFLVILKEISWKTFLKFTAASVLILLAFSPWLPFMFSKSSSVSWIEVPTAGTFFKFMYDYTGKNPVEVALYFFTLVAGARYFKTNRKLYVITYGVIFLTFIIPFIISVSMISILHNRYLILTLPALFVLIANVYTDSTKNVQKVNAGLALIIWAAMFVNIAFVNKTLKEGKEPWKQVAVTYGNLSKNRPLPIVAQENQYINYYLLQQNLNPSLSIDKINTLPEFWYLEHQYNPQNVPEQLKQTHTVIQTLQFSHDFILLRIKSNSKK